MAKKIDLSKIELGPKKPIKRNPPANIEAAVEQIHAQPQTTNNWVNESTEVTKRVTLDIPVSLHKKIKMRVFDLEMTMKQYFLDLAQEDLTNKIIR